jgi:hypothetical protein
MKEPFSYPLAHFPAKNCFGQQKKIPNLFDHAHFFGTPTFGGEKESAAFGHAHFLARNSLPQQLIQSLIQPLVYNTLYIVVNFFAKY